MWKVIIPTLNAAGEWTVFAPALLSCVRPEQVLIVDSQSTDGTVDLAHKAGFQVLSIARADFNHGGTRQMAADILSDADILVYLTQDAVLVGPYAIASLIAAFNDPLVAAACGRQIPRQGAKPIEEHARLFNYPAFSEVRSLESRMQLGIKTVFLSNSFAAYRRSALMEVGGFPGKLIFGEDTVTAARLLMVGHKIAYVADARVYHSHSYTPTQEFRRYFDIGVLHNREHWLLEEFGAATGEGKRFVVSELRYLLKRDLLSIPSAVLRTGLKLLGYRLGRLESKLPVVIRRKLSLHRSFWV